MIKSPLPLTPSASLSVLIPTLDETDSLAQTVEVLLADLGLEITEVLLIVGERTTRPTREVCAWLHAAHGRRVRSIQQSLPLLGGAFRSGIAAATGSQMVLMFADLESDPHAVPDMVAAAKANPGSVISASRWLRRGSFVGYGRSKLVLNFCFQRLCAVASRSRLTDFTYGFRLYPSSILKGTDWQETDHAFVLETILRPLLEHVPVQEVAAVWRSREEGDRRSRFKQYLHYLPTLLRVVTTHARHRRLNRAEFVVPAATR